MVIRSRQAFLKRWSRLRADEAARDFRQRRRQGFSGTVTWFWGKQSRVGLSRAPQNQVTVPQPTRSPAPGSTGVNWQQEEPADAGGRRQPSGGGTSRISREAYARFCERLGVKFPGPTRRHRTTGVPTATPFPGKLSPISRPRFRGFPSLPLPRWRGMLIQTFPRNGQFFISEEAAPGRLDQHVLHC